MTTARIRRSESNRLPEVDGIAVPGFIRNGRYFFTEISVFADGIFDCWGGVDLDFLGRKFAQGWICPGALVGEEISVHDLMAAKVVACEWEFSVVAYHERLRACLSELNPAGQDLVDFEGEDVEIREGIRWAKVGMIRGLPLQLQRQDSSRPGDSRNILVQQEGRTFLAVMRIYADGQLDVHPRFDQERLVSVDELGELLERGEVLLSVPDGTVLEIDTLGRMTVTEVMCWLEQPSNLIAEVTDTIQKLRGEKSSIENCRDAYKEYLAQPTLATKELLRIAYEAVPEHHRCYVGDMDVKDIPIRMVLYGEQEIENWSHRIVARSLGDEDLPTIRVPKPEEED